MPPPSARSSNDLPVLTFGSAEALRSWLIVHHATSPGIWVRIYKRSSGIQSVRFEELLDEGLCFGWSESTRRRGDAVSYLQLFTPRKTPGTTSVRNLVRAEQLSHEGRMLPAGVRALQRPSLHARDDLRHAAFGGTPRYRADQQRLEPEP